MNNEHYLIHKDDYIKHIDDKFQLFMMVQGLTNLVSKLPPDNKNIPAIVLAKHHRKESEDMFKTWGIPRSYMIFGSEADLADLMAVSLRAAAVVAAAVVPMRITTTRMTRTSTTLPR